MEEKKKPHIELSRSELTMLYTALFEFKEKLERIERPSHIAQSTIRGSKRLIEKLEAMILEIGND